MGHRAEENSISTGFCGGFYCHPGGNAASEGLHGLPRRISAAGRGGTLLRKKSPGLHKRTSNKLLSVTVLCFRPDLFFHVPLLPLSQRWGCRSEAGHGRAAYGRPAQDQRRNVEEPDSAVMFSTGRILSNIPDENLNIGTKPRHLDRVVLNTTLFTVFKAVLCGAGFGLLSSRSCSREQDKWEKLS